MQVSGTKEAFEVMLKERGVYKKLNIDRSTVSNYRAYLKAGTHISMDKMEQMLLKYGATIVKEKIWNL